MIRKPRKYVYVLVWEGAYPCAVFGSRAAAEAFRASAYTGKTSRVRVVRYERSEPKARTR